MPVPNEGQISAEEATALFDSVGAEAPAENQMSAEEAQSMFDTAGSDPIEDVTQLQPRTVWSEGLSKALQVPGWYHGGQIGAAMRENFDPLQEDATEIGRSFLRGVLKMPEAVGEAVRFVGDHIGSETLPGGTKSETVKGWETKAQQILWDQGDLIVDTWKNLQKSAKINGVELTQANPAVWRGKFMENPSYTRGIATVLQAIPSLAAGYAVTAATKNPWAGASVLGMVDGLSARGEAREAGKDVKTQDLTAGAVAIFNTLMEKIPLEKFFGGAKGKIAGAVEGALTEGGTEAVQTMWENVVARIGYDESRTLMAGVVESLLVGAVTGGALGGMSSNTTKSIDRAINKLRLAGMPEEQINELGYNAAVELAKNADTPILTTTLEDGSTITLSLNEAIGQRLQDVAKQTKPYESVDIKGPEYSDAEIQVMVEEGGGNFLGVSKGFTKKNGEVVPGQVQFRSPTTGSSVAIKVTEITPELVKQKIEESDKAFVDAEKSKSVIFFRGGGEGSMPRTGTAADVVNYETQELGNTGVVAEPGVDLKAIPTKDLTWVTETEQQAAEYGVVEPQEFKNYKIVARDGQGGLLIQELSVSKTDKAIDTEKATPTEAAKREELSDTAAKEQAVQEDPDTPETLQSALPQIITDLQTVTAKVNEYTARNQPVPERLLIRQQQMINMFRNLTNREQAQVNPRIKSIIREMTGQVELAPKTVTEMNALKGTLQMAARVSRETERQTEKSLNAFKKGIVEEIKLRLPPSKERGQFLSAIASVKYGADLAPIAERVEKAAENYRRKELLKEIKKQVKKIQNSSVISVDYVAKIDELMSQFETGMTPELRKNLEKTQAFIDRERSKGNDVSMPQEVLSDLQGLYREDLKAVDSNALQNLLNKIIFLRDLGRNKLRLQEALEEAQVSQALIELAAGSKQSNNRSTPRSILERSVPLKAKASDVVNDVADWIVNHQRAASWVDTVLDKFDGNAGYTGPNYKTFKTPASVGYRAYLNDKFPIFDRIAKLSKDLKLDTHDMNIIGFYATKVQEGGVDKLKKMGYSQEEIEGVSLNEAQSKMYIAFRQELDKLWPRVKETLRRVYNKDPESVMNYFPFTTDFEALNSMPISERFNSESPDLVDRMILQKREGPFNKNTPEQKFAKERTGGKQAVRLNAMQVFLQHVDNATYLLGMADKLKLMSAIAQNDSYRNIAGDQAQQFMNDWIDVLARNGRRTDQDPVLDWFRKNTAAAGLAFRLSSILVQGTALMDGATEIGGHAFEGATLIATSDKWRKFVKDNMPEVRNRIGDDVHFLEFGGNSPIDRLNQKGFWALQKFDSITAASVAAGAYLKYIRENNIPFDKSDPQSSLNEDALNYAQDVVARTQASTAPKDLPLMLSKANSAGGKDVFSNTSFNRLILQFQTFMLKRWDTLTHQGIDLGFAKGDVAKGVNVASYLALAKMAEMGTRSVLAALANALTGQEADEPEDDEVLKRLVLNLLGDVPFVSSAMSIGQYGSVPVPSVQLLSKAATRTKAAFSSQSEEAQTRNRTRAMLLWLGLLGGVGGTTQAEDIYAKISAEN